jgi:RNA-directed DNA polymerase
MLEKAREVTRHELFPYVAYARWADDLVVLIHEDPRQDWLLEAVHRRLREELAKLGIPVNEAKSRVVDLAHGETFTFLGFDFRQVRSLRGAWRPQYIPTRHKRVELLQKLQQVFRRRRSHPVGETIREVNAILAGWLNYFRIGHASRHFDHIRYWVERKVRRHLARAAKKPGFGRKRWSRERLYRELGLYDDYSIRYVVRGPKALPAR